jgi:hypothetical protein
MPVARIYASLVEEAEPICADLLARGYNVEIVFPDAVLPTPADLELRVERCSAEQAIARVEAGGSPSRCVFMTPSKGPHRELLLVEMTVLATGTDARHPMAMPIPVAVPAPHPLLLSTKAIVLKDEPLPGVPAEVRSADPGLAHVLPFPALPAEVLVDSVAKMEPARPLSASGQNLSGNLIAELNAFLAHAPAVERPEGLHVRIFENVRHSASVERARNNWEGLTLAGIAASLVMLMALGWSAGPHRPRQLAITAANPSANPIVQTATPTAPPEVASAFTASSESLHPVGLTMHAAISAPGAPLRLASGRHRLVRLHRRPVPRLQDDLVAQDEVTSRVRQTATKPLSTRLAQPTTTSELVQPPAIRSAPIKIITDLK